MLEPKETLSTPKNKRGVLTCQLKPLNAVELVAVKEPLRIELANILIE